MIGAGRPLCIAVLIVAAGACGGDDAGSTNAPRPAGDDAVVTRVVDGDTIVTSRGRVRFIGVDTPESVDPRRPVQCFGREASAFTSSLLPPNTSIRLVYDVDREDQYGRTLAYVYRNDDGLFVNAKLVEDGYANVLTVPPNVAHADSFVALARAARDANRGLWSACA
jgi:micrococcal nuclease